MEDRRLGHRRVGVDGEVTYKRILTTQIMDAVQQGLRLSVEGVDGEADGGGSQEDLLMRDFAAVETLRVATEEDRSFRLRTHAPRVFRHFRSLFGIRAVDFVASMCGRPLRELPNPGASGSVLYVSADDEFVLKTVQHRESDFLGKLLPGYYINLTQNPRTLLPKFFGLYCYRCNSKNVRLVVMNNLIPSTLRIHQKYDLKGSTFKRRASKQECRKESPTFKDVDFVEQHPEGLGLDAGVYTALLKTIERDCRVLESFKIIDYSLLLGVHNVDRAEREGDVGGGPGSGGGPGIPARDASGDRLLLFLGIIDILQNYRLRKRLEHTFKSILADGGGGSVSVHAPDFYSKRFQSFAATRVFRRVADLGAATSPCPVGGAWGAYVGRTSAAGRRYFPRAEEVSGVAAWLSGSVASSSSTSGVGSAATSQLPRDSVATIAALSSSTDSSTDDDEEATTLEDSSTRAVHEKESISLLKTSVLKES